MAAFTMMAFSNALRVSISESLRFSFTISTIRKPDICANTFLLESAAGMEAFSGSESPIDSTIQAIVEAVPITAQWPRLLHMEASACPSSSCVILPVLTSSLKCQISLVPISFPLNFPVSIGPPDTTMVGILTLQAPIPVKGVVLSQTIKYKPSVIGTGSFFNIHVAVFRKSMVVVIMDSPSDITGNSNGNPPAFNIPFTDSASSPKCALQGKFRPCIANANYRRGIKIKALGFIRAR